MKNTVLLFIAFILSFGITIVGLNSFFGKDSASNSKEIVEEPITEITEDDTNNQETNDINETDDLNENPEQETEEIIEETIPEYVAKVNIDNITANYKTWQQYNKKSIELSNNFTPIDVDDKQIEKEDFLSKLKTGLYIPVEVEADDIAYKLVELKDDATSKKIGKSERNVASVAYHYFKKEGTPLPKFDWEDLDGNNYTTLNTKGKIKVIKCWFINCMICVQEFPELNELYDRYEGNDQIQFLSLAFDKADKLKEFLSQKEFRFPVIPEQRNYMAKELEVKLYPTHVIVDEDNNIIKMVTNVKTLISIIDQLIGDADFNNNDEQEIETQF